MAALKNSLKPTAIVYRDGKWDHGFDATKLVPGDLVELALGAVVPAGMWWWCVVVCGGSGGVWWWCVVVCGGGGGVGGGGVLLLVFRGVY